MPPVSGLVSKNPANVTQGKHVKNYSSFDRSLSYRFWNTHRFADIAPTFVTEGVPSDVIHLNSYDRIDSLSLNAPFKGSIKKIKESFMVPNMAILPFQWDRIYAQPTVGEDVPVDCNCIIRGFPDLFSSIYKKMLKKSYDYLLGLIQQLQSEDEKGLRDDPQYSVEEFYTGLTRLLIFGEYVYSSGSLLHSLGYKRNADLIYYDSLDSSKIKDFDWWFDQVVLIAFKETYDLDVSVPEGSALVSKVFQSIKHPTDTYLPFREFFDTFRETPNSYISEVLTASSDFNSNLSDLIDFLNPSNFDFVTQGLTQIAVPETAMDLNVGTLNLSRLLAYQLIVSHFYTNSNVDFMYSAELYRQYFAFLIEDIQTNSGVTWQDSFLCNDYTLKYDYLSGHALTYVLGLSSDWDDPIQGNALVNSLFTQTTDVTFLVAWSMIFGYRKALRYGDYFTGSRPRPLAPVDTDVAVNNGYVSVVNITRNIQAERFANAIMRTGRKIEEYVQGLFGRSPQPDFHNPFFLARQEEIIFGDSVQNTAESQASDANSRTANFAGNLSAHTFTFHNDDMHPCIYMQLVHYDIRIAYSHSVDRQFLHEDRFDMFNPDFQYIGDQAVYGIELGTYYKNLNSQYEIPDIFSFTGRDMEYKQRFDVQSGAFACGMLPGWSLNDIKLTYHEFQHLSPDFIRWRNSDIDDLYLSLTGYSLGNYFHFICITDNNVSAKRPMAVDPQILG